jgi:hypothetical protein
MAARAAMALGWLGDVAGLLLIGLSIPVAILLVGMPVALLVRLLIEVAGRF